jgi:hypothetical protein
VGPGAALFDSSGLLAGTHALDGATGRPSWTALDGSRVVAQKVASDPSPTGSIPWLLLQVTDLQTSWSLFNGFTSYVQRVNTVGGQAPAIPCNWITAMFVPFMPSAYSADYVYYYYFG